VRGEARPPVDEPERVRAAGPDPPVVIVGEELRLVRRDVDVRGAVALAALAGEAQIERLLHRFVTPAAVDRAALEHLPEQVRAAAGRVLLLARHHEARAHRVVAGLAVEAPALADADAALRGVRELAVIVRVLEVRLGPPRRVARAEPEILVRAA